MYEPYENTVLDIPFTELDKFEYYDRPKPKPVRTWCEGKKAIIFVNVATK